MIHLNSSGKMAHPQRGAYVAVTRPVDFPANLKHVWIYLRKSREDHEAEERARREGRSEIETLARHKRTLLDLARKHGHHISHILEELVSGEYISERPEMLRLLHSVEAEEVSAVWVMDLDRLGRGDMADQGTILRTFKDSQTLILTPEKVYDLNDEMDEEWTEFKAFFARRELKMITKRMQRGRVASVLEGKFIGTRPPFGYDVNRNLVLVPNQDAQVVRKIFDLYVHTGFGCNRIAHYLNSVGIQTPMGKRWRGESVLALIKNPVYCGWIVWRKVRTDKRKHTFRIRPQAEWIRARGKHEPLIDEVTYERSVQIREARTHAKVRSGRKVASPLTGLIQCGKCGEMLIKRPYSKQAAHLICKNPNCPQKSTRLAIVEEKLLKALTHWLKTYTLNNEEISAALSHPVDPIHNAFHTHLHRSIEHDMERVSSQLDRLHDLVEQGTYDSTTYTERKHKLEAELADLKQQKGSLDSQVENRVDTKQTTPKRVPLVSTVLEAYQLTDDVECKNNLLKSILQKAVYTKEKWQRMDEFELILFPLIERR